MSKTNPLAPSQKPSADSSFVVKKNDGRIAGIVASCWQLIKSFFQGVGSLVSRCITVVFMCTSSSKKRGVQHDHNNAQESSENQESKINILVKQGAQLDEKLREIELESDKIKDNLESEMSLNIHVNAVNLIRNVFRNYLQVKNNSKKMGQLKEEVQECANTINKKLENLLQQNKITEDLNKFCEKEESYIKNRSDFVKNGFANKPLSSSEDQLAKNPSKIELLASVEIAALNKLNLEIREFKNTLDQKTNEFIKDLDLENYKKIYEDKILPILQNFGINPLEGDSNKNRRQLCLDAVTSILEHIKNWKFNAKKERDLMDLIKKLNEIDAILAKIPEALNEAISQFTEENCDLIQRKKEIHNKKLASHLFSACLDQCPSGQVLIQIKNQTIENNKEDEALQEKSTSFFDSLYRVHERDLLGDVQENEKNNLFLGDNAACISKKFDFKNWHQDLYEVWKNHLGVVDEAQILQSSNQLEEQKRLFNNWIHKKTGIAFEPSVEFTPILNQEVGELEKKREKISNFAKTIKNVLKVHKTDRSILGSVQEFLGGLKGVVLKENQNSEGLNLSTSKISHEASVTFSCLEGRADTSVDLFEKGSFYPASSSFKEQVEWVARLFNPKNNFLKRMPNGYLHFYAAFFDIIPTFKNISDRSAIEYVEYVDYLMECFADFCLSKEVFAKNNEWGKKILHCYLEFYFSCAKMKLKRPFTKVFFDLTEQEKTYLKQFINISGYTPSTQDEALIKSLIGPKNEKNSNDAPPTRIDTKGSLKKIGEQLQKSEIGLEGLSDSFVQLSTQESEIVTTAEFRAYLESLRARAAEPGKIAQSLLKYTLNYYSMDHCEGQQAIKRAILYAYKNDTKAGIAWLKDELQKEVNPSVMDPSTLVLPKKIFLSECLMELSGNDLAATARIANFNRELMDSNESIKIFLGCAREIVRLSNMRDPGSPNERFDRQMELVWLKIAYQSLKATYIDGKLHVSGFLKLAIDDAEMAIAKTGVKLFSVIKNGRISHNPEYSVTKDGKMIYKDIWHSLLEVKQSSNISNFLKDLNIAKDITKEIEEGRHTFNPPCFLLVGETDVDLLTGCVYQNGLQQVELPSSIKNHADLLFLHLQDLPYTKNSQGEFVHYTAVANNETSRKAQVIIKPNQSKPPIIQRFLSTEFNGKQGALLEYLPRGNFKEIPAAITKRMGVYSFWKDSNGVIYGHSEKGELIVSYKDETLTTREGDFDFSGNMPGDCRDVFVKLAKILPGDEILIGKSQERLWIPAIGLTIEKNGSVWCCSGSSISGKILDLDSDLDSTITLKSEDEKDIPSDLLELKEDLTRKLGELNSKNSLTARAEKASLQRELLDLQLKITSFSQRIYIKLLPENDSQSCLREFVLLEDLRDGTLTGRDLSGLLFLLVQQGKCDSEAAWIAELAKYPLTQPMNFKEVDLLNKAIEKAQENNNIHIHLYLNLLLCEHNFLMMQEASRVINPNKPDSLKEATEQYQQSKDMCCNLRNRQGITNRFSAELEAMYNTHCPDNKAEGISQANKVAPISFEAARQLQAVAHQSLLERLRLSDKIEFAAKKEEEIIGQNQKEIIDHFKSKSQDQVEGFYWEELGWFSSKTLEILFKLDEEKTKQIIEKLKENGWIQSQKEGYLSVVDEKDPLAAIDGAKLRAILANCGIHNPEREIIANRLTKFLFQAAQAHFSFSWKNKDFSIKKAIASEEFVHRNAMLDAEFALQKYLGDAGVSLTEFKRRVLTGDTRELSVKGSFFAARNALLCYLVHKTEYEHILNSVKAPLQGERNQIELLSTARQYSIDLLLKNSEDLNDEQKQEWVIQLAFLLFEEDYGARCNSMQVKLFRSMMLDQNHSESIDAMQARMGFGKTALLPLMALVQIAKQGKTNPEQKSLIRYVVPKAVFQDNAASFHERIFHILGSNVLKDKEFSRYQIDSENMKSSFKWIFEDLCRRLDFYTNARNKALVLIQSPEIRHALEAQEHIFKHFLIKKGLGTEVQDLCIKCIKTLGKIRSIQSYTIYDELDATQDFKSCEVNFTDGNKLPIDRNAIRPLCCFVTALKNEASITDKNKLAQKLFDSTGIAVDQDLLNYVTNPNADYPRFKRINLSQKAQNTCAFRLSDGECFAAVLLIRAIVLDSNIFDFVCNKQPGTHFGVRFKEKEEKIIYSIDEYSDSALLIAVPYEGTNTPKGLSIYDNTEVAAIATLRYYLSDQTLFTQDPHVDFLIKQMKRNVITDEISVGVATVKDRFDVCLSDRLRKLTSLLDKVEIEQAKKAFYEDFLKDPCPEVRAYFGMIVVAGQVRTDEMRANSNRYEMGSIHDQIRGCSGTVGNTSSYFVKSAIDPAADGKLSIEIMGRSDNAQIGIVNQLNTDYIEGVLTSLLEQSSVNTRAIIDAAGLCKTSDGAPETIVKKLWDKLQNHELIQGITGIVYYGKNNVKMLYRGPDHPLIVCTTAMEEQALIKREYFSFYGQKNTRGSDIKQPDYAHALVTMDENVSNSDAKQAILRFRSLVNRSSFQKFTFMLTSKFELLLKNKFNKEQISASDVASYLRDREYSEQEGNALVLFKKELEAHVGQAATYYEHVIFAGIEGRNDVYMKFLQERKKIVDFVQKGIVELEDKYGQSLKTQTKTNFIESHLKLAQDKLTELLDLAKKTTQELNIEIKISGKFFEERITESEKLFKERYSRDQVETGAQDMAAEAVAQAQAQAQAQAVAESVAQNISESEVQVHERLPKFNLIMTQRERFVIEDDWFTGSKGTSIGQCEEFKNLVHPWYRDNNYIMVSPQLKNQRIVSHFILAPTQTNLPYWWISQEEAEHFLSNNKNQNPTHALVDLRTVDSSCNNIHIQNIKNLVLLMEVGDFSSITSTDQLINTQFFTASSEQFLPRLTVTRNNPYSIKCWMDLSSFGISEGVLGKMKIEFKGDDKFFIIQIGQNEVKIPKNNLYIKDLVKSVYRDDAIKNKIKRMGELFLERLKGEGKENWLEEFNSKIKNIEGAIKELKLTFNSNLKEIPENDFFAEVLENAYYNLNNLCKPTTPVNKNELMEEHYRKYNGGHGIGNVVQKFDFGVLITEIRGSMPRTLFTTWKTTLSSLANAEINSQIFKECLSLFEIYEYSIRNFEMNLKRFRSGEYEFNSSLIEDFKKNFQDICRDIDNFMQKTEEIESILLEEDNRIKMFALMNCASKIQKKEFESKLELIESIIKNAGEIKAKKDDIVRVKEDYSDFITVHNCIQEMKQVVNSEYLEQNGIRFFNESEDREVLWDRFLCLKIFDEITGNFIFELQGSLPDYLKNIKELTCYKDRVCVLNDQEKRNLEGQIALAEKVKKLSCNVEPRLNQLIEHPNAI